MKEEVINLKHIHKRYPGVYALRDVSITLRRGEIHALVGENGAGKSTLIKILSGILPHDEGEYYFEGKLSAVSGARSALTRGISVVHQELNLASNLSVAENIFYGNLPVTRLGLVDRKTLYNRSQEIISELGLNINPRLKVEHLSIAQQQLVEIAKSLIKKPKVIILDEPTSALSSSEVANLFGVLNKLKMQGTAILFVSHKLNEVLEISDQITVFRDGLHITTDVTSEFTREKLISLMVGREDVTGYIKKPVSIGETVLSVKDITTSRVYGANFEVRAGEIVGFSGLMGAGRTELARAVFGIDKRSKGSIYMEGKRIRKNSAVAAYNAGLGLIPESRKDDGLFLNFTVRVNMTISALKNYLRMLVVDSRKESTDVNRIIDELNIKTTGLTQIIFNLSGGNQQKVIIGRWLLKKDLKVLIVDEPTRGIDVGAKTEIYEILNKLAENGLAIVIMSSELPELLSLCDRIYVMKGGEIVAEVPRSEATEEALLMHSI